MKEMTYNTQRDKIAMAEYGRSIQEMVDYCVSIENRERRNRCARTIVNIMATLEGEKMGNADVEQKMWNHLAIISGFKLDIDYPVEIIRKEEVNAKPEPLPIPTKRIRHRHYGHLLEEGLAYLKELPEGEERTELTGIIANRMKQSLFTWNPENMSEERVVRDVARYTNDEIADELEGFHFGPLQSVSISIKKKKKK